MFRKTAIAAAMLVFGSTGVLALGMGDISMKSMLNQPMQAEIDLTSVRDTELSDIKVSLASQEAHQRAGLNKSALLNSFTFAVEKTASGNAVVKVTSLDKKIMCRLICCCCRIRISTTTRIIIPFRSTPLLRETSAQKRRLLTRKLYIK